MIFLSVGIYAEGPTDELFLCNLLDRLIPSLAHEICNGAFDLGAARRIDEPRALRKASREARIAAAIEESLEECNLFVLHSDGASTPEIVRREQIEPGLTRARRAHPELAAAACVPVREIEAWMLADSSAFRRAFEVSSVPSLPRHPEAETDPKAVLEKIVRDLGAKLGPRGAEDYYALLGAEVSPELLRRLPAFLRFEAELRAAIATLARTGGA